MARCTAGTEVAEGRGSSDGDPVQLHCADADRAVKNSGLENIFEPHLSTDRVSAYKPDPRAYQMGVDAFGLSRQEIAFVAFGGWDAAGARSYGYPTFWVNRMVFRRKSWEPGPTRSAAIWTTWWNS